MKTYLRANASPHPHATYGLLVIQLSATMFCLTACLQWAIGRPLSPADHCGFAAAQSGGEDATRLTVWARAYGHYCWRAYAPVLAATQVTDANVVVTPRAYETLDGPYRAAFVQAAQAGAAPDIVFVPDYRTLVDWADAGYLTPLDTCLMRHPEFQNVEPRIWQKYQHKGQIWGSPFEVQLFLLFFSKVNLRRLGWSDAQIADLPDQIRTGQFTLDDLLDTVEQAVTAQVVQPGFGFWPDLHARRTFRLFYHAYGGEIYQSTGALAINREILTEVYVLHHTLQARRILSTHFASLDRNTWSNRVVWRDSVTNGRVLFWTAFGYDWATWRMLGQRDGITLSQMQQDERPLEETIGYALFPSAERGKPGLVWWNESGFYAITSQEAAGRDQQAVACAVIAKTLRPEINGLNAAKAGMLTALKPHLLSTTNTTRFITEIGYMWDYAATGPIPMPAYGQYHDTIDRYRVMVEREEMMPADAAQAAVQELQGTLDDFLTVELHSPTDRCSSATY